ncbi:MAG: methionyl-tRNA formyltransferase [Candidatus Nealsonbacteria bacterium]|nr:methionyl-tRNA formyltransferase [Candidatus Nealsonbacteria bacterium]
MENNKIKIVFIGTPEFGATVLERLIRGGFPPVLVITETDKPSGRKQIVTPPPVKITAQKYDIQIEQPEKILNLKSLILNLHPDLIIVAAYGQILPKEILEIPKYGCLNVHPSLLPKYRGATPVQSAILNGDKETGVTIMLMDEGIDTGPILSQKKTEIGSNETYQELHGRLAVIGSELLTDTIPDWIGGRIKLARQDEKIAVYTKILAREDGLIDWRKSPEELDRRIRALNPWPGTYTVQREKRIKVLKARLESGKLIIESVQPEGKKPMSYKDFLRGNNNLGLE